MMLATSIVTAVLALSGAPAAAAPAPDAPAVEIRCHGLQMAELFPGGRNGRQARDFEAEALRRIEVVERGHPAARVELKSRSAVRGLFQELNWELKRQPHPDQTRTIPHRLGAEIAAGLTLAREDPTLFREALAGCARELPELAAGAPDKTAVTRNVILVEALRRPKTEDLLEAITPQVAREINGEADLDCRIGDQGELEDCRVTEETPLGWGVGQAALSVTSKYLFPPPQKEDSERARRIDIGVKFRFTSPLDIATRCHGHALVLGVSADDRKGPAFEAELKRRAALIEARHPYRAMTDEAAQDWADWMTAQRAAFDKQLAAALAKKGHAFNPLVTNLGGDVALAQLRRELNPAFFDDYVDYCRTAEPDAFAPPSARS